MSKRIEFEDKNWNKLTIQHSSAVDESYRIYVQNDGAQFENFKCDICLHLSRNQVDMLIAALNSLKEDND